MQKYETKTANKNCLDPTLAETSKFTDSHFSVILISSFLSSKWKDSRTKFYASFRYFFFTSIYLIILKLPRCFVCKNSSLSNYSGAE